MALKSSLEGVSQRNGRSRELQFDFAASWVSVTDYGRGNLDAGRIAALDLETIGAIYFRPF